MELKEFDIMLDIKKSKKIEDIEVVQKDYESNILNISIVEGFEPYNLSGLNVEIAFAKPDGTTVLQDEENGVIIEDPAEGKIRCILNTNTIAASGKVFAEVRILQDLRLLTTARFDFFVRRAIVNDETIESTNEFPILNQLINTTQDLIEQVGQIEQQVPENVVTQLNEVSDLANQLQVDLAAHKADYVTEIANRVKKDGDTISGVYRHNGNLFRGLLYYNNYNTVLENGIKIKTKITAQTQMMVGLHLWGYLYDDNNSPIDLYIQFYPAFDIINRGLSAKTNTPFQPELKIAEEDGFIVIFINVLNRNFSFNIDAVVTSTSSANIKPTMMYDWQIVDETILENATNVKTIPYVGVV